MLNFPYISRILETDIGTAKRSNRAKILLGPRQVGKSTLLSRLVTSPKSIFLTGEDDDDVKILTDSKSFLELTRQYTDIVIDEAQYVPGIGRTVKRMVDNNNSDARIFVTGSSSLELASGVNESAAGRFNTYNLWPLSLEELALNSSWIEVKRQMNERLIYGCHPTVVNEPELAENYLKDFSDTLLFRDLKDLAEVRKPTELNKLIKYLAYNVGSEIRYGSLSKELGISNKTIERFIDLLESCFIVKVLPSYSNNPKSELKMGKKIYFYDNGIRNALIRDFSPVPTRKDIGALWENLFFTERLKYHAFHRTGAEIFFWRTRTLAKMDFVELCNGKIQAFECKFRPDAKAKSLRAFKNAFPDCPVTIATPQNIDLTYQA